MVPRLVKEEFTTAAPSVVLSKTLALLIRNTPAVGRLRLLLVKLIPPLKVVVALFPI